ncbi:hypothetical protein DH2020_039167 [Rehmannia glutinosa]|uniref:VIN3-like protein n=1 Tax=Rehmannia glutinosa TaxID=99300 RepID=A0ABR0UXP6_REHGL
MEQKRKLVYEMSKWPDSATEILQSWSRQEILQILCAELGKERKYTGLTKSKMIEQLLKIVYEKESQELVESANISENGERNPKRQRKSDNPNRQLVATNGAATIDLDVESGNTVYCKNSACKAKMNSEHDRQDKGLDGSFCCVACGKVNDLLRLSLGQKILAGTKHYQNLYGIIDEAVKKLEEDVGPLTGLPVKKARGIVNRLSSGPEIQRLCAFAVESLDLMLSNRVSDIMPSGCNTLASKLVRFEDIRASSVTVNLSSDDSNMENVVGYSLWHRKANDIDYPTEPTCRLKFSSRGAEYKPESLEVERSQSPTTNCSSLSNPSSEEDETNNIIPCNEDENREDNYIPFNGNADKTDKSQKETNPNGDALLIASNKESSNDRMVEETSTDNGSDRPLHTGLECVPYVDSSEANLPITPCKFENLKDDIGRSNRPKSSGKEIGSERDEEPQAGSSSKKMCNSIGDKDFEYYVKVVRWLECDGHIETTFRQKFLTWYSLRATSQELRIVKVFIDTFIEDPVSLAGQLVDTFSDLVSHKRCSRVPAGFCTKLWH